MKMDKKTLEYEIRHWGGMLPDNADELTLQEYNYALASLWLWIGELNQEKTMIPCPFQSEEQIEVFLTEASFLKNYSTKTKIR